MLRLLQESHKGEACGTFRRAFLQSVSYPPLKETIPFGPFNSNMQKRWKKPVDSAQTRLENRTRDLRLDKLRSQFTKLELVMRLQELISKQRGQYMSVQLLSKCRTMVGVNIAMGAFLRKYPHVFEMCVHPVKKHVCCKVTQKMVDLIEEEARIMKESELEAVQRLRKLIMMSKNGTLNIHALWLMRRELGLPDDFRNSILPKYPDHLTLVHPDTVALVMKEDTSFEAEVEKWRAREYTEKWLSEFETRYAFPIQFPTGFKIEKGCRESLKNWQRLPYLKPYEKKEAIRIRTCGGTERFEKRAVGILHEFLGLTVEKMVEVERLSHFRRDFNMEDNVRELLLKHPGIFYISTKGNSQTVFLREAYSKGCLIEPNSIYEIRRRMLGLTLLGCRNTNQMQPCEVLVETCNQANFNELVGGPYDGDCVIPLLQIYDEQSTAVNMNNTRDHSDEKDSE